MSNSYDYDLFKNLESKVFLSYEKLLGFLKYNIYFLELLDWQKLMNTKQMLTCSDKSKSKIFLFVTTGIPPKKIKHEFSKHDSSKETRYIKF